MDKKAQIFSTDLMISASIFISLIIILISTFYFYSIRIRDNVKNEDLYIKTIQISDILLKTAGIPSDWETNSNNTKNIGLIDSDRIFSTSKIREFVNLSINTTKEKLNIEGYNFYFSLKDSNGALYNLTNSFSETGIKPSLNAKWIIIIKRIGIYGGQKAYAEFILWE